MNAGEPRPSAGARAFFDAIFVSDIHLSRAHPATAESFFTFLDSVVLGKTRRLYILGDLFEAWAGDDDCDESFNARVIARLRMLSDRGVAISFMAGNRDFLIGPTFAERAGLTIISDPHREMIDAFPVLLSHGDALCTDDVGYQEFRAMVRTSGWQAKFLAQPLAERKALIAELRSKSESEKVGKTAAIMDVNEAAAARLFEASSEHVLIHGHTHRPAHHLTRVGTRLCERWVLPDWDGELDPVEGGALALREGSLVRLPLGM